MDTHVTAVYSWSQDVAIPNQLQVEIMAVVATIRVTLAMINMFSNVYTGASR